MSGRKQINVKKMNIIIRGVMREYVYYGWRETTKTYCRKPQEYPIVLFKTEKLISDFFPMLPILRRTLIYFKIPRFRPSFLSDRISRYRNMNVAI
jgi:hypothetical protein